MIKVYGIPNCNTVQKAIAWLKDKQLPFEFHDYKKEGITKAKLKEWSKHFGWTNILNKNGTTYKELSDEMKSAIVDEKSAVHFLEENTSGIKRPIIEYNGEYLIRFDEQQYNDVLLAKERQ
jgi:Spx/MgsR family transcriptional regulator